jgi:hypothetical protein
MHRTAYLLTGDENSERALFSKHVLENIGFCVQFITYISNINKVLSNKMSMQYIYELISNTEFETNEFAYIFEDDINVIQHITIDEIVQYENISEMFFYLGMCDNGDNIIQTNEIINNNIVYKKSGYVRGLHAIGLSKRGAIHLLKFSKESTLEYMDMILENFSLIYPANIVRYDLTSYIEGHKGIIFQDRNRFQSTII